MSFKLKRGEILEVRIVKMAYGGRGIAKLPTDKGELIVFVPNTIPGQLVACKVEKQQKNHIETKLWKILEPSPDEVEIPYQPIAGAPYARLPIALQELYKKETSIDLFARIGGEKDAIAKFDAFISSPTHWHYRNKMEYAFSAIRYDLQTGEECDDFGLGFKHRGTWWMVENLDQDSGLFDTQLETNLHLVREFCRSSGLPAWHPPKRKGFFRYFTVRKSYFEDRLLFNLVTSDQGLDEWNIKAFAEYLTGIFGKRMAGLIHTINRDTGDRVQPLDGDAQLIAGVDFITESMLGLKFEIRMPSFFQTNPKSAERLYSKALDYLQSAVADEGLILDLFCGTGTITQLVAQRYPHAKVVGVDIVESAIEDARRASRENQVGNAEYHVGDVGKFLQAEQYAGKSISGIMLDPPRAGIAPKTLQKIMDLGSPSIVYISCNPATLARDTKSLAQGGYQLVKFSLVDQFPHTAHIEAVSLFAKAS